MSSDAIGQGRAQRVRDFTVKSLVFAFLGVVLIAGGAQFNNEHLQQTLLTGNHMPPGPFFLVLLLGLAWNPLVALISRAVNLRWLVFSTGELTVVLSLMLMMSWIPGAGLGRYAYRAVVMPCLQVEGKPDWKKYDTLGHIPESAFPLGGSAEALALAEVLPVEQRHLAAGDLDSELNLGGSDRAAYATALDLISLVPAKQWRAEPASAWRAGDLAVIRMAVAEPVRAKALRELLDQLPKKTLEPADGGPFAWALAWKRVGDGFAISLPEANKRFETTYTGFKQGLPLGNETITLDRIPWRSWFGALSLWGPLFLTFALATLFLGLVLHRQWSHHELLGYPIATVMGLTLARGEGKIVADVFRDRLFWFGLVPVLCIHLLNLTAVWFPGRLPSIGLHWANWTVLTNLFPDSANANCQGTLAWGDLYFSIIGLSYFIAAEISLSLGLCNVILFFSMYQWYLATGTQMDDGSSRSGAFIGYALILAYTGRHYYWSVLVKAFGLQGGAAGEQQESVWAARLFLLAISCFVVLLVTGLKLDWFVACVYAATLMLGFSVFSRIVCETGIPLLGSSFQPASMITTILGVSAVGAAPLVLINLLGAVFTNDTRENMQPYVGNAFKLAELGGVRRFRLAGFAIAAIVLAMVVGFIASSWGFYQFGAQTDQYACDSASRHLNTATTGLAYLQDTGQYAIAAQTEGLAKLGLIGENTGKAKELGWMAYGALAVIGVSLLRFRVPWWPIHPVAFCVGNCWGMSQFWLSFLLGWAIKGLIVKFAGGKAYQFLKPLFVGLILGEIAATGIQILIGLTYWWVTDLLPKSLSVFPG